MQFRSLIARAALATCATAAAVAHNYTGEVNITDIIQNFYGFPDIGNHTYFSCPGRGHLAGGSGTYEDPVTMAVGKGHFEVCEIFWDEHIRKYVIYQDHCPDCNTYDKPDYGVSIHIGSNQRSGGANQSTCEETMTDESYDHLVRNPSLHHKAKTWSLYDVDTDTCHYERVYPDFEPGCNLDGCPSS